MHMNNHFVGIDEKPPFLSLLLMGIQHVLVLFSGLVAVPLVVGMALGLPSTDITVLVQGSLIVSGTGTLIQCLGLGHLDPVAHLHGLGVCLHCTQYHGGVADGDPGRVWRIHGVRVCRLDPQFFIGRVQKLIPPLVTGTIVSLIGIKLLPLGFTWLAGGHSELYGKPVCFLIGGVVLVALLVASQSRKRLVIIVFRHYCHYAGICCIGTARHS
jgi:NCS2 family nucleobase:cation symporter-2